MNPPDEPTFHSHCGRSMSTIDLTFINYPADDADTVRDWAIDDDWSYGSDHGAIKWTINHGSAPIAETGRKTWKNAKKDRFCKAVAAARMRHIRTLQALRTPEPDQSLLDQAAKAMREILTEVADQTVPIRRPSYHSKPFWTDELTDLRDGTVMARRSTPKTSSLA
ncbi:hypothetical protein FRC05_007039 [Tulasnella sp. 425]|nr:hypothetical protein FRC05_007039 [Tulasnella sp. 425]